MTSKEPEPVLQEHASMNQKTSPSSSTTSGKATGATATSTSRTSRRGPLLHVEVTVPANNPASRSDLQSSWKSFLASKEATWKWDDESGNILQVANIPQELATSRITIVSDTDHSIDIENMNTANLKIHCFVLNEEEAALEELEPTHDGDDFVAACENLTLPHKSLDGLWDSLIFSSSLKSSLLHYAESALLFSDMGVSNHVVHWNRLLLLHGPPGTGKTSLCRALAHKLAIRLSDRFEATHLLEIQSHSLFSKWFSTSGKLVNRLFDLVKDMVQDYPNILVCVLLDEVESLAASRSQLGGDPADSMRAVNSLLTSLDRLKVFPNVLILSTTNMTNKVDAAFTDRADLSLFVGNPIQQARHEILKSCLKELQRVGLIATNEEQIDLTEVALLSEGMSGRSLRRLPLQTHALYLFHEPTPIPVDTFIAALAKRLKDEALTPGL
jgi:SpoVK/Ycf46/Vps4 family AAA+-type ATPase